MSFTVIIPARIGSERLAGKLLLDLAGKPIVKHVCERALSSGAETVIVATDDQKIAKAVESLPVQVCMTSPLHTSGTERLAEVVKLRNLSPDEIVVNVQGDEPMISPINIQQVAANSKKRPTESIATLCVPMESSDELVSPNIVKVVMDKEGRALYFSRAPIPWDRERFNQGNMKPTVHYRHIGLYAYRAGFLSQYVTWEPSALEQLESLEQLRALWYGHKIHVAIATDKHEPGVDTREDLERIRSKWKEKR